MPLPKPKAGQTESQFMQECMSDETMKNEYPNPQQRLAVCAVQWRNNS